MINFFDFDGVIVDSIDECYIVSKGVYFGYANFPYDEEEYKALFYKYRGLVRPAYEYMTLHESIEAYLKGKGGDIGELFKKISIAKSDKDKTFYEKEFFYKRSLYQSDDMENWLSMNPIMPFGKTLVGRDNHDVIIVTTKNKEATNILLEHYKIKVNKIYANDEIKCYGSKGLLITHVMDENNIKEAIFLDDAVEHLETVKDNRVACYFADWGYGFNNKYKVYKWRELS
jgi:phosphoglycolate phosphatase-like HAD superfamily hydrolase